MKALFTTSGGYKAVIKKIQNIYPPEEMKFLDGYAWRWGFKYDNGTSEFFQFSNKKDCFKEYEACSRACDFYWRNYWEPTLEGALLILNRKKGKRCYGK